MLLVTGFASCSKKVTETGIPSCLDGKISIFRNLACTSGANVREYRFQNQVMFVFDPGLCGADQTSEVLDDQCKTLGHLGGITGNNKINGEDFSKAVYQKTVWSN